MTVRDWLVAQTLNSFGGLRVNLRQLSEEEVLRCLEVEASSQRRQSVTDRLIKRAVRLRELSYARHLKEKFNGTHPVEDPVAR